ncbi:unnamed protein product [Pleuronectes platessa]|uniref:Uncharacterized protein n=1 Tax=Pleuronectes platessa TaxID=8262 RepID=A0A9N7YIE0_PLEPL|nr:unnamed protein product [Pleuronectes platessa]
MDFQQLFLEVFKQEERSGGLGCSAELREELAVQLGRIQSSRVRQLRGLKFSTASLAERDSLLTWSSPTGRKLPPHPLCIRVCAQGLQQGGQGGGQSPLLPRLLTIHAGNEQYFLGGTVNLKKQSVTERLLHENELCFHCVSLSECARRGAELRTAFLYLLFSLTLPNLRNAIMSIKAYPPAIIYPGVVRQAASEKVMGKEESGHWGLERAFVLPGYEELSKGENVIVEAEGEFSLRLLIVKEMRQRVSSREKVRPC